MKSRYIRTKLRTYSEKVYNNFRYLNVPEGAVECESITNISIVPLLVHENKYHLQVYLDNCVYKFVDKQITDYLDDNLFETDEHQFCFVLVALNGSYECCIAIELI